MINLSYGGSFDEQALVRHIRQSGRNYIIQGQQNYSQAAHTKPDSLDYWLRQFAHNPNTKQADNKVIAQLVATGLFQASNNLRCPNSGRPCKGLVLICPNSSQPCKGLVLICPNSGQPCEAQQIAQFIFSCFKQVSQKYDFKKYPKCAYDRFKLRFSALNPANQDIHDALIWKYGHWGKKNFPKTHRNVISDVQGLWPQFIKTGNHHSSYNTFQWWQKKWPKTRYITVAFITHLIHHNSAIPIIDQHNFRAMNNLIAMVRKNHSYKKKPSSWQDILDLKDFMDRLLPHLNNVDISELDRFLMMWGKCVLKT